MKSVVLLLSVLTAGALACGSTASPSCISSGTSVNVTRTNGTGACPASVVSGVTVLNGMAKFTAQKDLSCGVTHFNQNVSFTNQDSGAEACQGAEALSFQDLTATGDTGTDTITITCAGGVSCTETFDVTWATP